VIGQTIGSYTILDRLGAGAMGEVYLGEHRLLKRKVAIKLLAKELVSRPELLERFFNEARATSVIAHPGIVQIFDCELDAEGRPYIVMEYLTGETLGKELARRKGALPITRATRLAQGIAEALEAAHAKGIIHRDLKPDNVFATAEPVNAVKVVDFGIAKLVGDLRAGATNQTHAGAIMGTPLYMSPEQCRASGAVDFRTDIYSLGCVLFEMLTGRPPFISEGVGELLVDHLQTPAPDVQSLNPAVPAPLASLVAELLQKSPADRPASMNAVAVRLSGALDTAPPASTPTVSATAAPPRASVTTFGSTAAELHLDEVPSRRSRLPWVLGAGLAVALAGGGLWLWRGGSFGGAAPVVVAPPPPAAPPSGSSPSPQAPAPLPPPRDPSPSPPEAAERTGSGSAAESASTGEARPLERREARREGFDRPAKTGPGKVARVGPDRASREPAGKDERAPSDKAGRDVALAEKPVPEKIAAENSPTDKPTEGVATDRPAAEKHSERAETKANVPAPESPSASGTGAARSEGHLAGTWEGPWSDTTAAQQGRLYLVIGPEGQASGWFNNKRANESFRLVGRVRDEGQVDMSCQCPASQMFTVKGTLHASGDGLEGPLFLWSGGRTFGRPYVNARRVSTSR